MGIIATVNVQAQDVTDTSNPIVPIAPVVNYVAVQGGDGNFETSRMLCAQNGGFLPAETTLIHHEQVVQAAQQVTTSEKWFAYLGGSSNINDFNLCPDDKITAEKNGEDASTSRTCLFRWNQGRWLTLQEPVTDAIATLDHPNSGVSFFKGNLYNALDSITTTTNPIINGFASFFDLTNADDTEKRPNVLFGQYVVAVGQGSKSVWSDNVASGGYAYENWKGGKPVTKAADMFDLDAMDKTRSMFVTVCQVQTFDRATYEQYNTTSGLQERWWVIFLVFFFVVCFVGFVIVAACQEREDMDEPPEDAPEWAEEQNAQVKRSSSFVSAHNLPMYNDTESNRDDNDTNVASRQGSVYSSYSRPQHQNSGYTNPLQTNHMMQQPSNVVHNNWM